MTATDTTKGKVLQGTVVKSAMKDTCTVAIERYVVHPNYKVHPQHEKIPRPRRRNTAKVGDKVEIRETARSRRVSTSLSNRSCSLQQSKMNRK